MEVAAGAGVVHVRDSKTPDGPVLTFTPEAWAAFTVYATRTPGTVRRF
ncbi:toxin-antitoxin system, toxin component [Streptomyces sp. CNQ-509]|nr:toxin-antitoxin system, toxin component [Streptomyces sp. CNQ-509]